ncbi:hypothetical protein DB32_001898 [Sandaracinus amylolyticus]|uniref:Uncharacterized protein n=1 Tax=Sandaracinus amylolyticus TaxID=927083 RepID=A0A0F6SE84_9BACT|nr:hypothetical protein DB32_001898 [Sandaracinus amylolyticus]
MIVGARAWLCDVVRVNRRVRAHVFARRAARRDYHRHLEIG